MKRGFVNLFLIIFSLVVLISFVIASHEEGHVEEVTNTGNIETETSVGEDGTITVVTNSEALDEADSVGGTDVLHDILEEHPDAELKVDAGITPDSALYFIDEAFDGFQNPVDVVQEKCNELRELVNSGNTEAAQIALENLNKYTEKLEKEVSPDEKEEVQEAVAAVANTIEEIKDKIPEDKKEEFVDEVLEKQKNLAVAAVIAEKINELCGQLIKLGEFKKASEVCNLDKENKDEPEWLRGKKEGWNKQLEGNAQEFFNVLTACMEVTNDGVEGDSDKCECDKMPDAQAVLCVDIAASEDACNDGKDESACGVSEPLMEQFMSSLPDNLREAMKKAMNEFGQEDFERHGAPPDCQDLTFRECMLQEAEKHLQYAPEECRDPIRDAIKSGEVSGEADARRICEEIMYEENRPEGCEDLAPDKCAERYGGPGRGEGGPGGIVFQVCDNIKNSEARLACYDANAEGVKVVGDYHREKQKFREEFNKREFEDYEEYRREFSGKFEGDFRRENVDKYADLYAKRKDYEKYYYNEEGERRKIQETLDREEKCVQQCASQGLPWTFINGDCECLAAGDYGQPPQDYRRGPYDERYYDQDKRYREGQFTCGPNQYFDGRKCVDQQFNNVACNYNGICDPNESPVSCSDCGGYSGGQGSCSGPTPACVGAYCSNGAWQCPTTGGCTGTPQSCEYNQYSSCENGQWVCKTSTNTACGSGMYWDSASSSCKSTSTSCGSGYYWVPEPSNSNGGYCAPSGTSTTTTTTNCPSGTHPEAGGCVSDSTTTTSCPSGQHLEGSSCVSDSTTTGSVISGRAILENPFLRYYFGY